MAEDVKHVLTPPLADEGHNRDPGREPVHPPSRWEAAAALALCAVLAVGMTQPLAAKAGTHLVTSRDTLVHYWNGWWIQKAVTEGHRLYHTSYLFHPQGVSLAYQNIGWLNAGGWIVLRPLVSGLAAHNITLLLFLALCGFAAFTLARELTGSGLAGMLAAVVYQNWPARLSRLNFPNLINTACLPLSLFFLARALRRQRMRDAALAGFFVALTGYTRLQHLIPASMAISLYLCFAYFFPARAYREFGAGKSLDPLSRDPSRAVQLLLVFGLVAAVALLPPAFIIAKEQISAPRDLQHLDSSRGKVTDLLAYVTPPANHPYLQSWTGPLYRRYYTGTPELIAYVGLVPVCLALLALLRDWRASIPWLSLGLCLFLLGLGPNPCINGTCHPRWITLYGLIDRVLPLSLIRVPGRFNVFLALPAALLSAYGAMPLLDWTRKIGAPTRLLLILVLGSVTIFEYLPGPQEMHVPHQSALYSELAEDPEPYALLNVPVEEQAAKVYMFAQTEHGHPIMQGHVSRLPDGAWDTVKSHPWLDTLRRTKEMSPAFPDVSRQLGMLADWNVRVIALQKTHVASDRVAHWRWYLAFAPFYEDRQLAAYRTQPTAGRDFELLTEPVTGLGPLRIVTSTPCVNPGGVLAVDIAWGSSAPPGKSYDVALSLASTSGRRPVQVRKPLSPGWPSSEWPADAVAWGYYTLSIPSAISSGTYTVSLDLLDSATGAVTGRIDEIGTVSVSEAPCAFRVPPDSIPVEAVFGNRLRLLGYRLRRQGDHLVVVLYWRAERRMTADYKVFVHVFDPATLRPVAQDDARPHRGAYPTPFWWPGEVVEDHVPIDLKAAPCGTYGLAVGIYDPATMERLPAVADRQPHLDGRFELPGESVVVGGAAN